MRIVYIAQEISGLVEYRHPPVETRVAKEKLKAFIEEALIPVELVTSYSIADDDAFPYPSEKPNILKMDGFFGLFPNYSAIVRELDELYAQPEREYAEFEAKLEDEMNAATDDQMLDLVEKYHYMGSGSRKRYEEALEFARLNLKPYEELKESLENTDHNYTRGELARSIATLDDCHIRSVIKQIRRYEAALKSGNKEEVKKIIKLNYSGWRRKNLARLHNYCDNAKNYGAGFWIARLEAPDGEAEPLDVRYRNAPKTVEEFLDKLKHSSQEVPYQVVKID